MNILILTSHLNPGGISRYVITLGRGLIKQGHNVWVASTGGEWVKKLEALGIKHKIIPIKTKSICSPKILLSFLCLKKLIKQEKINVVHGNTRVTQFLSFLIYKFIRIPYLSSFHGFYRATFFRYLFKFSGLLTIAVSQAVKRHLIDDFKIREDKIRVIYNGLDIEEFSKTKANRKDWGFPKDDYLIGILGRISQEKGHSLAVEALSRLQTKYKNIYLLISGEGKVKKQLQKEIDDSSLGGRVKFLNCEAGDFLDIIDLLLVPSKKEGFGYSIIEAFAKGVPVIGYKIGGIAEIIKNRQNGILFFSYESSALADAIEEVFSDESLRDKIVTEAKKDVLSFSDEVMAKNVEKAYLSVL